ncbi:MAG: transcriptional regulator [Chloracidobacterium sp. CP2_5A]|nr:MAG: transcriptional regulator [Chloracidobacterium sp. CP2_5A]
MKLITAIIRPERLAEVKSALFRVGVTGLSVSGVRGHGGEPEIVEHVRGQRIVVEFTEKVELRMAVSEPFVEPAVAAILTAARTGAVGDGKIFIQSLERVIRIRTGEENEAALTPLTAEEVQARALQEAPDKGTANLGKAP